MVLKNTLSYSQFLFPLSLQSILCMYQYYNIIPMVHVRIYVCKPIQKCYKILLCCVRLYSSMGGEWENGEACRGSLNALEYNLRRITRKIPELLCIIAIHGLKNNLTRFLFELCIWTWCWGLWMSAYAKRQLQSSKWLKVITKVSITLQ